MNELSQNTCTAFDGSTRIASGDISTVARQAKNILDQNQTATILIFDNLTSELIEVDFRGTSDEVVKRLADRPGSNAAKSSSDLPENLEPRGPGRPKLGVIAREVTLLPRHWDWLNLQPGGASVALRKLVESARREYAGKDKIRQAQEASYKFMSAMAGNQPYFEEATRALFAGNQARFDEMVESWPNDIREHAKKLAVAVFQAVK